MARRTGAPITGIRLQPKEREQLDDLTHWLSCTKSDAIRLAIEELHAQVRDTDTKGRAKRA